MNLANGFMMSLQLQGAGSVSSVQERHQVSGSLNTVNESKHGIQPYFNIPHVNTHCFKDSFINYCLRKYQ